MKSNRSQNISSMRLIIAIFILVFSVAPIIGNSYKLYLKTGNVNAIYPLDSVESIKSDETSTKICLKSGFVLENLNTDIDSLCFVKVTNEPITIEWKGSYADINIPMSIEGLQVASDSAHITVSSDLNQDLSFVLKGSSENGSILFNTGYSVIVTLDHLDLKSSRGSAIANYSSMPMEVRLKGANKLSDGKERDSLLTDVQRACFTSEGNLFIKGEGTLKVTGNFKHGIYSKSDITVDSCKIEVKKAKSDGIRAKLNFIATGMEFISDNIGDNAINADDECMILKDCDMEISLDKKKTVGLKSKKEFIANNCAMHFLLTGDQTKGIKSSSDVIIADGYFTGSAEGNVVVKNGDPSYCSFVKCDGNLLLNNANINISHTGKGGRGFSTDKKLTYLESSLIANFACDGDQYINEEGVIDYYTSRILGSDQDMHLISGSIDIFQSGLGGKGINAGEHLEIGKLDASSDSLLRINVETTGTAIVNDTILDERFGCPKAIKGKGQVHIYSGFIHAKTHGMGGEGIECGKYMKMEGGEVVCQTFDDGINPARGIKINGGRVFVFSSDNDGIDTNGYISLNGGIIVASSAHFRDEDFDCDQGYDFSINGGTILGIARDFSRPTIVEQPYIQHTPALWLPDHSEKDSTNVINFYKDEYITIADKDNRPIITTKLEADIPCAYITASSASMVEGEMVNVFRNTLPPLGSVPMCQEKIYLGGLIIEDIPEITMPATKEILGTTIE